jgi:hypothetical protein
MVVVAVAVAVDPALLIRLDDICIFAKVLIISI